MIRRCSRLVASLLLFVATVGACRDDVTGAGLPGTRFVAGAGVTDTVQTKPAQALVVEVRDEDGGLAPGRVVRFESVPIDPANPFGAPTMLVSPLDATFFRGTVVDTTDDRGRAAVLVQFGTKAGRGGVVVTVPEFGFVDTANFTITAGAAARVAALPKDTAVYVGATLTIRSAVTDRFGNPRSEPVTLTRVSGGVALQGNSVTAQSGGMAKIVAQALGLTDTTLIAVVPPGVLAVARSGVGTVNLDGSGFRLWTGTPAQYVRWAPSGSDIAFDRGYAVPAQIVTMAGAVRPVRQTSSPADAEMYPVFSPDGAWVYVSVHVAGFRLWRARPDGTEAAPLTSSSPEDDFYPSPSPDGTRLVYVRRIGGGQDYLRILDLGSGAVSKLDVPGHAPAWSPVGDLIAYVDLRAGYVLKVMRPDGSGQRQVSLGGSYEMAVHWSPDGAWLIAYNNGASRIHLIEVATGATMALGYSTGMRSPAWRR